MKNPRITPQERGLLKNAIRRVFSRSDLRSKAVDKQTIDYSDPQRPRVKKWSICPICQKPTARYQLEVDHIEPVVPLDSSFDEMSWDTLVDRIWCQIENLQAVCIPCHTEKSSQEMKERNKLKRIKKIKNKKPSR